jgi:Domain of unknown function (DUF4129)
MRRFLILMLLVQAGITHAQTKITVLAGQAGRDGVYDEESFARELQSARTALDTMPASGDLEKLRDSLPQYWTVKTSDNTYVISSAYLKQQLSGGKRDAARAWVYHALNEVRSYSSQEKKIGSDARAELDKILAGNEFVAVHAPSAWDLFRQRLAAWISRLLYKLFGGMERYPITGEILFWIFVIVAVGFIALWLFRFLEGRDRMDSLPPGEIVSASQTWQEWIRAARDAAGRRDFREAVHSAYWAGIARLEDRGLVPKDRARTPREYLRLVAESSEQDLIDRHIYRAPLTELTKRLERVWYANRGAGKEDFAEALKHVKAMGCQLD